MHVNCSSLSPCCCHSTDSWWGVVAIFLPGGEWWQYSSLVESGGNIPPRLPAVAIPLTPGGEWWQYSSLVESGGNIPHWWRVVAIFLPGGVVAIFLPGGEWWQYASLVESGVNMPPCLPAVAIPLTPAWWRWWQHSCLSPRCCHSTDSWRRGVATRLPVSPPLPFH